MNGGRSEAQVCDAAKRRKVIKDLPFQVAFGLPWTCSAFVERAVNSQHPFLKGAGLPYELQDAIDKLVQKVVD